MAKSDQGIINLEVNQMQLQEAKQALSGIENGARDMLRMALNKTITGVKTDVKKAIAAEINLTQKRIARDIYDKQATSLDLNAKVYSKGKRVELIDFGAKAVKDGVTYKISKSGERQKMAGGFIATGQSSGKQHVLKRTEKVGTGTPIGVPAAGFYFSFPAAWPETYRYPAHIKYGPSIPEVWGKPLVLQDTVKKAEARLTTEIERAANKLLADAG